MWLLQAANLCSGLGNAMITLAIPWLVMERLGSATLAGLVLAAEILVATGTVRESIHRPEGNPPLKELMEQGVHPYGMQTFEMVARQLHTGQVISKEVARAAGAF